MIKIKEDVKKAMQVMGFEKLMAVQEAVIPLFRENKNIVVRSRTGSGKTAAYGIPLCEMIDWDENEMQACILVPTRELVIQVSETIRQLGCFGRIKVVSLYGKEKEQYQVDAIKQKCHIAVATPGRLLDFLQRGILSFSQLRYLVIDEADYMLDLGFDTQVLSILSYVTDQSSFALFSATYPIRIQEWIESRWQDFCMVDLEEQHEHEQYYAMGNDFSSLCKVLRQCHQESSIIFCERQSEVETLQKCFMEKGMEVCALHGGMLQKKRFAAWEAYRKGEHRLLIATDVAARGLDIEKADLIIHYRVPHTDEEYVHRIGRSGRKDTKGMSILLIEEHGDQEDHLIVQFGIKPWEQHEEEASLSHWEGQVAKKDVAAKWKRHVCKLYVSAGKRKKIRAGDIIGAFCSVEGVNKEDIGVIEVLQNMSYVEIFHGKEYLLIEAFMQKTIKNKKVKVEIAGVSE